MPAGAENALSRRALFGAGLARALSARLDEGHAARRPAVAPVTAGEADAGRLGAQLAPVARHVLERTGLTRAAPRRVLVVAAGDGAPLAESAAELGHRVVAVEADRLLLARGRERLPAVEWRSGRATSLPVEDHSFDSVIAWFGAAYEPDPRGVARELRRAAGPQGTIALTAWRPSAMRLLRHSAPVPRHRPEQWSRYETAYRHFFDCPGLDVEEAVVEQQGARLEYAVVLVS